MFVLQAAVRKQWGLSTISVRNYKCPKRPKQDIELAQNKVKSQVFIWAAGDSIWINIQDSKWNVQLPSQIYIKQEMILLWHAANTQPVRKAEQLVAGVLSHRLKSLWM